MGAIYSRSSSSRRGLSLSGPAAFPGFKFCKSFRIPATEILKPSITGVDLSSLCFKGEQVHSCLPVFRSVVIFPLIYKQ